MKRYVIFVLIGPAVGGLILLATTTYLSGYWTETNFAEVRKFFVVLFSTLQFSYLFGLLPCLAVASIDDRGDPARQFAVDEAWLRHPLRWIEAGFGTIGMTVLTIGLAALMWSRGHRRAAGFAVIVMVTTSLSTTPVQPSTMAQPKSRTRPRAVSPSPMRKVPS